MKTNELTGLCQAVACVETVSTLHEGAAMLREQRQKANYRFGYVTPWVDAQGGIAETLQVVCVFAGADTSPGDGYGLPLLMAAP